MPQDCAHPMIPVPDAIRIALQETAKIVLENRKDSSRSPEQLSCVNTPMKDLLGQVLAQDVTMPSPGYPPYPASIMDGYAIRVAQARTSDVENDWTHQVHDDKVYAGDDQPPSQTTSNTNLPTAYYITTGAVVPDTYDCVVPIEECQVSSSSNQLRIASSAAIQEQKWIRPVGCDIPENSVVLPKGHVIDPVALGLLRQSAASSIRVKRRIRIGVLSTGNELVIDASPHSSEGTHQARTGKIPDVNRPVLLNLIQTFGDFCQMVDLGTVRDDNVASMEERIQQALDTCDVIVSTGGVSMGETDIVEHVLVDRAGGTLHFGRMHMKPGKPTTLVTIPRDGHRKLFFAMPGNPVSAIVCTHLLVKPCLDLLFYGAEDVISASTDASPETIVSTIVNQAFVHPEISAALAHSIRLDQQRPEYARVTLQKSVEGKYLASTTGVQRSSRLMSCRDAQGLLVLPIGSPEQPTALEGESYTVLVMSSLRGLDRLRVDESKHLQKRGKELKVGVVEVLSEHRPDVPSALDDICQQARKGLSGSKSGNARIVSRSSFQGGLEGLYVVLKNTNKSDVVVVVCRSFDGCFEFHLDVSAALSKRLHKPAEALALQARQGAAAQDSSAALFEFVVGFAPEGQGALVICLPERGLESGLGNVRGLLKHAVNVARGKPHNHHHTHQSHDHGKP